MKITESESRRNQLVQLMSEREFSIREGIHQSDLVYCLNKAALRRWNPKQATIGDVLRFSRGYATQRWLTGRPDEEPIVRDGVTVTLDATWPNEPTVPWELKNTDQSSTKPIVENTHWLRQLMAQAYVKGITTVVLTRWANLGNWKWVYNRKPKPEKLAELVEQYGADWDEHPKLQVYEIEFTGVELKLNWDWLQRRKNMFEEILRTHKPIARGLALPSLAQSDDVEDWECNYCQYNNEEECRNDRN